MKKLYLVRHAKSSWDDPDMDDFGRPLNDRGLNDAPRMAKKLRERGVHPDRLITSPALRAKTTCQIFADEFGINTIQEVDQLYHASPETWLAVLHSLKEHPGDQEDVAIFFGHNPGITEFANQLLNCYIDNIPTCGIVSATLNIDRWTNIRWGCGRLDAFDYPKK